MCLFNPTKINLKHDITTFKVMLQHKHTKKLIPPFYRLKEFTYVLGETSYVLDKEPILKPNGKMEEGIMYSCPTKKLALEYVTFINESITYRIKFCSSSSIKDYNVVIVKCVIPKTTDYCYYDDSSQEYGSQALKPIRIIKKF